MGNSIRFTIPGSPMGKGRVRISKGGFCFTPENTMNYENLVKVSCIDKCQQRQADYAGQVAVDITAFYPIPSSYTKKKQEQIRGGARPVKKPDLDNIAKIVLDCFRCVSESSALCNQRGFADYSQWQ
jgi:Holliday junction resolvase RusA-like endonuclease